MTTEPAKAKGIKRYDPDYECIGYNGIKVVMEDWPHGDWVKYADISPLLEACKNLILIQKDLALIYADPNNAERFETCVDSIKEMLRKMGEL